MYTVKGNGVQSFTDDIKKWHYKKIQDIDELAGLIGELK
jgi:hypothetical protein